jgi:hypothetical protein
LLEPFSAVGGLSAVTPRMAFALIALNLRLTALRKLTL